MDTDSKVRALQPEGSGSGGGPVVAPDAPGWAPPPVAAWRLKGFGAALLLLVVLFIGPLGAWARFALRSELYSHVVLIPLVCGYIVWLRRGDFSLGNASPVIALVPASIAAVLLVQGWHLGKSASLDDFLFCRILSFVCLVYAVAIALLGWQTFKRFQFPAWLLLFMVPFPSTILGLIETGLQHGSASAAHLLFWLSGTPVIRQGTQFQLPGISIQVAPECSGIHSTLVLFITSIIACHWFLKKPFNRLVLVAVIIPLALLRNGLRIFTIGQLCVHYGRDMLKSYIHHNGGPIFFALSLIPLFMVLISLIYLERRMPGHNQNRAQETTR